MRRVFAFALGALTLGGLTNQASAQSFWQKMIHPSSGIVQVQAAAPAPTTTPAPAPAPAPTTRAPAVNVYDNGCANGNCGGSCGGSGWHATADVGFMVLKPVWRSNPAIVLEPTDTSTQVLDFDFGPQFVPKISLGVVNCDGFGGRINWWGFAESNTRRSPRVAATDNRSAAPLGLSVDNDQAGDVLTAHGKLNMNVWDFEALKTLEGDNCSVTASGGLRYAHIAQRYDATNVAALTGSIGNDSVFSGNSFNGAGPTISLEGTYKPGRRGLFLYANGRGSVLFGKIKQRADVIQFETNGVTINNQDSATSSNEAIVSVGELELGAGWDREVRRTHLFFRAGLVGQIWWAAGNSSRTNPLLNEGPSGQGASISNNDLGLIGFSMTAGIRY